MNGTSDFLRREPHGEIISLGHKGEGVPQKLGLKYNPIYTGSLCYQIQSGAVKTRSTFFQ